RRQADENALVADTLEQCGQHMQLVLSVQPVGQRTVRRDADGFAASGIVDALRMLVPIGLTQAEPVHLAAGLAVTIEILQSALGVAVLPGVDAGLFGALEQLGDSLRSVPV